ncbi:hypothetical protein NLI96_g9054 [Meripilus lineatus]|uniref:Uncharacterized protein n=1 Tax=Meripilus lineatus TaxID=2056292 RepID=A0AAD5YFP4_9APHY|nr:hypothetical protein NLI96_g9054 [Physisporinus lineatus]
MWVYLETYPGVEIGAAFEQTLRSYGERVIAIDFRACTSPGPVAITLYYSGYCNDLTTDVKLAALTPLDPDLDPTITVNLLDPVHSSDYLTWTDLEVDRR